MRAELQHIKMFLISRNIGIVLAGQKGTNWHLTMQVVESPKLNVKGIIRTEQVYKGISDCFSKTYRESGIKGLYRGVGT